MRSSKCGSAPGIARAPPLVPRLNPDRRCRCHCGLLEVPVERERIGAVIDDHQCSKAHEGSSKRDAAAVHRAHSVRLRQGELDAIALRWG